jgi:serine-type D-Ala-D-Ala carboxypeptidase (penicillin-binding protein 5/6)
LAEVSFGMWLKSQRSARGLTQKQLAHQIGCATITLRKIEAEKRRPSIQFAKRLADIAVINPPIAVIHPSNVSQKEAF